MSTGPIDVEDQDIRFGVLDSFAGYHLRRASGAFSDDFTDALAGTGIRQSLLGILCVIKANPSINQGAAGRSLGIQRANMVALINQLADAGLVDRQTDSQDRRAFALNLTEAGVTMLDTCIARVEEHERRMLAVFSNAERAMLIELLSRVETRGR